MRPWRKREQTNWSFVWAMTVVRPLLKRKIYVVLQDVTVGTWGKPRIVDESG
jgi:hypothetical protein